MVMMLINDNDFKCGSDDDNFLIGSVMVMFLPFLIGTHVAKKECPGGTNPIYQPICFRNPTPQCSNPIHIFDF